MKETNFQNIFVKHVLENNSKIPNELSDLMIPIGKIDVTKVMNVYSEDYKYRMLETFQSNYESIWMVLGDSVFEELVFDFIVKYLSTAFDLNFYGDQFPEYLVTKQNILEEVPFLIDLANFEIKFWKCFHSKNPENKKIEDFTQEQILNSMFLFSEQTQLIKYEYNIFPIFLFKDKTLDDFLKEHDSNLIHQNSFYLLYKKDHKVICHSLSSAQYSFFFELSKNKSIIDVINSPPEITQEEVKEIFTLISSSLLRDLKGEMK